MNYFLRALREASKSWPLLAAALLCSAGVAASGAPISVSYTHLTLPTIYSV